MTLLCYYYVQIHIALHANRLRNFFRMFFLKPLNFCYHELLF